MKAARAFRRELDAWATAWQQVETFLDRIDGARDADDGPRSKVEALLRAAAVVERRRAAGDPAGALSEPVVDVLPQLVVDPATGVAAAPPEGGWGRAARLWRVPGTDELELAVAQLAVTVSDADEPELTVHEKVRLPRERTIFTRSPGIGAAAALLRLPAYPGGGAGGATIVGPGTRTVDVAVTAPQDRASLFARSRRRDAAMAGVPFLATGSGDDIDAEPDDVPDPLLPWSELCRLRRAAPREGVLLSTPAGRPAPVTGGVLAGAGAVLAGLASGSLGAAAAEPQLLGIAGAARANAVDAAADAGALLAAVDELDAAGARTPGLADALHAAADSLPAAAPAWQELADAADALRPAPASAPARSRMQAALVAVVAAGVPGLLGAAVEAGALRADLDEAVDARIGYPDGTLRVLRALEAAFAGNWRGWVRWFRRRDALLLEPMATRFRAPFVLGVRALVNGGDTGLLHQGLSLGTDTAVGADTVTTAQPASLVATLDELEPGTVGVLGGERPAALVVLGLDRRAADLALSASPLRVSTARAAPGLPGLVAAGTAIGGVAAGATDLELRLGRAAAGAAADGPVHEAVALWSRLCLVHGRDRIDAEVGGPGLRSVPEPTSIPLQTMTLHGGVPAYATGLFLARLRPEFWLRAGAEPVPLLARPGELLLLRGRAAPPDGAAGPGPLVQAVVEVERVTRAPASVLDGADPGAVGVLATDPAALPGPEADPCVVCGPQEDLAVVVLRRSWLDVPLVGEVTLRRDFAGFEAPNLATGRLLPLDFLGEITGRTPAEPAGVAREAEFAAALEVFSGWTQYARQEAS